MERRERGCARIAFLPTPLRSITGCATPTPRVAQPPSGPHAAEGRGARPQWCRQDRAAAAGGVVREKGTAEPDREHSAMHLKSVDPRTLKVNPNNPRRMSAGEHPDAQMVANIQAVGILQPPVVREDGEELEIVAGHRRVAAAIAAGWPEILVLVRGPDDGSDALRAMSENVVRAQMGPVDQWRAIEALVSAEWTEEAIATALALPVRTLRKLRLLAQLMPAMLDQMALGDMPDEGNLRTIAAASSEEQATVWKKHKPKKGQRAVWWEIARALARRTLPASVAKFGAELAQAYGIVWTDDLFAEAGKDARTTSQVDAFLGAQGEWLANNLPKGGSLAELDQYGSVKLPPKARRRYDKARKGDLIACYVDVRTGEVEHVPYTMPEAKRNAGTGKVEQAEKPAPKPRADITGKGVALIGDIRTEALHQALQEAPIGDDVLIGLLVLALGGRNVQVDSGAQHKGHGWRERVAEKLTEGGVLTQDLELLRLTAREMLVEVLSCRDNKSQSGMVARHAGATIGADDFLPNMATQEFLSCLSKQAMERVASNNRVLPRTTGKQTRAALIEHVGKGCFVHPAALFAPTPAELEARRRPESLIEAEGGEDEDPDDQSDALADTDLEDELDTGEMPPPGAGETAKHQAA